MGNDRLDPTRLHPRVAYVLVWRRADGCVTPSEKLTYVRESDAREAARLLNDEGTGGAGEWLVVRAVTTYEDAKR